jgi:hypothetical protein
MPSYHFFSISFCDFSSVYFTLFPHVWSFSSYASVSPYFCRLLPFCIFFSIFLLFQPKFYSFLTSLNPSREPGVLTKFLHIFPQFQQTNAGTVACRLPTAFSCIPPDSSLLNVPGKGNCKKYTIISNLLMIIQLAKPHNMVANAPTTFLLWNKITITS